MRLPLLALGLALAPYGSLALALSVAIASFRDGSRPPAAEMLGIALLVAAALVWPFGLGLSIYADRRAKDDGVARTVSRVAIVVSAVFALLLGLACLGGAVVGLVARARG